MNILISVSVLALSLLLTPTKVLAQQEQQNSIYQQKDRTQDPATHEDTAILPQGNQIQNQVKTQNEGEDSQLNVNTQENLQDNEDSQGRSDIARQNMSNVAQKIEELLANEETQGGIGQQVKIIAQQQKQTQGEIENQLNKLTSRQGLMKKLFGADQKAIKNLKQRMEQNQLRIQQLQELKNQVANQAEETQIQELVLALVDQNIALENLVQAEEQIGSVFGWLIRLFNR